MLNLFYEKIFFMDEVIIVAGGEGKRMGSDVPKQFLLLKGKPLLMHTITVFYEFNPKLNIIVVLPAAYCNYWQELCRQYSFVISHKVVEGGKERFFSVKNALNFLDSTDGVVAVHDGVRPLVSRHVLHRCFEKAYQTGAVIPVVLVKESLRKKNSRGSAGVCRNEYWIVQTPQVFRKDVLLKAYRQPYEEIFTDDASVVEKTGIVIHTVDGNEENIKITSPFDLLIAETYLQHHE